MASRLLGGEDRGGDKLYGTSLGHFGAFGNPEWRKCDFTWGRLDATAHVAALIRKLDDTAHVGKLDDDTIRGLEREVLVAEGWKSLQVFAKKARPPGRSVLLRLLLSRSGPGVLLDVTSSAAQLMGHQVWTTATGPLRRLTGRGGVA